MRVAIVGVLFAICGWWSAWAQTPAVVTPEVIATTVNPSHALALDPAGALYYGDGLLVIRLDLATRNKITVADLSATASATIVGLALDGKGGLFVSQGDAGYLEHDGSTTYAAHGGLSRVDLYSGGVTKLTTDNLGGIAITAEGLVIVEEPPDTIASYDPATGIHRVIATGLNFHGTITYPPGAPRDFPTGIALDRAGNILVPNVFYGKIQRIDRRTGEVSVIAGNGTFCAPGEAGEEPRCSGIIGGGISGDGGAAIDAGLNVPAYLAVDASGNTYVDSDPSPIWDNGGLSWRSHEMSTRFIHAASGTITRLKTTLGGAILVAPDGTLYYADGLKITRLSGFSPDVLAISKVPIQFGDVPSSTLETEAAVVHNVRGHATTVATSGGSPFTLSSDCPATLPDGGTCTLQVSFNATDAIFTWYGDLVGTSSAVTVTSANAVNVVAVTARSVSHGLLTFNPAKLDFGDVRLGTTSAPQAVTITNVGDGPMKILSVEAVVTDSSLSYGPVADGNYSIVGGNCPRYPVDAPPLLPGLSCTSSVRFTPQSASTHNAQLRSYDDATGAPHVVPMTGRGVGPAGRASYLLTFAVHLGVRSAPQTVRIDSIGTEPLQITGLSGLDSQFEVTNNCLSPVAPGGSCTLTLTVTPTEISCCSRTLVISTNSLPLSVDVGVKAYGLTLSPTTYSFGDQMVGATAATTVTVSPEDARDPLLNFSAITSGDFIVGSPSTSSGGCPASGTGTALYTSCLVRVEFRPTAAGNRTGSLVVSGNFSGTGTVNGTVNLSGVAYDTPLAFRGFTTARPLDFGSQPIGSISGSTNYGPYSVTLLNLTQSPITIGPITASGDFLVGSGCATVAPGPSGCTVRLDFAPTVVGPRTGTLTVTNGATAKPLTLPLTGNGLPSPLTITPSALSFDVMVGSESAPQSLTLTNNSASDLPILAMIATALRYTTTCGTSLLPLGSCQYTVTAAASQPGVSTGVFDFRVDLPSSPTLFYQVRTTVTATLPPGPAVSLSAAALSFDSQLVGSRSGSQTVSLLNSGQAVLAISAIFTSGDFAVTHDCPTSLVIGAKCTVTVTFTPTTAGTREGGVWLHSNAPNSPSVVTLAGTGMDFSVVAASGSPTSIAVAAGQTAAYSIAISSLGGFAGTVNLSCSGAPPMATCTVTPSSFNPASGSPASISVVVATTRPTSAQPAPLQGGFALVATTLLGIALWRGRRQLRRAVLTILLLGLVSCGGSSAPPVTHTPGTPAGPYTIVVSATSGSVTRNLNLSLAVQ